MPDDVTTYSILTSTVSAQPAEQRLPALRQLGTLVLAFALLMTLGLAVVLALLVHMGRAQDAAASTASRQQFAGLMTLQAQQLAAHVRDYTHWDEAIDRLATAYDPVWWSNNAGDFAVKGFTLSFSLAIDGKDQLRLLATPEGSRANLPDTALTPSLRALLMQARALPASTDADVAVATGFVDFEGQVHQAAAVRYLPESENRSLADPPALLVFAHSLDDKVLPTSAGIMALQDLQWRPTAPATPTQGAFESLRLADGTLHGGIGWTPPTPGHALVMQLAPLVTAAFVAMAVLLLFFLWRSRRLALAIHADAQSRMALDQRNRSILEAAGEGIFGVDALGKVTFVNPAALRTLGFTADEFLGQPPHHLIHCQLPAHQNGGSPACPIRQTLLDGTGVHSDETHFTRRDGSTFPVELHATPMLQDDGQVNGAVMVFRDITHRSQIEAEIRYRAHYDSLTGLPNRDLLHERLTQELKLAQREGKMVGLLFLDLDHFKNINDASGHEAGDQLLQQVAQRLRACLRDSDTVGRLGGDEFALLLPHLHHTDDAGHIAEKAIAALSAPFTLQGQEAWIGASVGITVFPFDGDSPSELLRHADLAMYKAKGSGRNTYQYYKASMTAHALQRRTLEADLRHALSNGQLRLHYQPIVELASGHTVHVEALLRWQHPSKGMVSPGTFIPLAEETGLIVDIGAWVLDECCRQIAQWRAQGINLNMTLNVSGRQVPQGLPLPLIASTLSQHGIPSAAIAFEITETVLLNASGPVKQWLDDVQNLGIDLLIDDFGTGYSSLSYLKHFTLKSLKVDRSFVSGIGEETEDQALVKAILAMAQSLGLSVVAEGVETEAQRDWLRQHGCEYAQGYLFGRPVDPQTLVELRNPIRDVPLTIDT